MKEYPHIDTIWMRGDKKKILIGEYSCPEFAYLADNTWIGTEKVDGTNIRVMWNGAGGITFGGKTDDASIPAFLIKRLMDLFLPQTALFAEKFGDKSICLYGEGYGAKIRKGGGNYKPDSADFVLFDALIDGWWLRRESLEDIAAAFGIQLVPIVFRGTLTEACDFARSGYASTWGEFPAEGLVLKPEVDLMRRNGDRIIAKIKHRDFR